MKVRFLELDVDTYDEKIGEYDYSKAKFITCKKIKNVAEFPKLIKQVKLLEIDNDWYKFYDYTISTRRDNDSYVGMNVYVEEYL
ncbi:hypothetical protein [Anaerostipes sp. Marseille-Q3525]|uniref:hypothetical protein n=1 Tax=Anaerostipes sp. Marseille-Q3525 TaxID=2758418 RepID=UPI001BAC5C61|nr:hypothetical protein [Anaerostipes sp. Marseille-Q3525]MBR9961155.1 hypothetical protein [Anaerostipes sp. Marseille-Q3525]